MSNVNIPQLPTTPDAIYLMAQKKGAVGKYTYDMTPKRALRLNSVLFLYSLSISVFRHAVINEDGVAC